MSYDNPEATPIAIFFVILWMILNIILFIGMIPGDPQDLNNYIEVILWIPSIIGLAMMKKWGVALNISVLGITLGTSLYIFLEAYYLSMLNMLFAPVNALRIIVNAVLIIYLFKIVFSRKFG